MELELPEQCEDAFPEFYGGGVKKAVGEGIQEQKPCNPK
jgi:hypothetical protein